MTPNKFKATWVSASSLADFIKCPRSYYLKNVYKDNDNKKISTVSPYLSLGIAVHETLEPFAYVPSDKRQTTMFGKTFYNVWENVSGEKGGFDSEEQEDTFKQRGVEILTNVRKNIKHLLGETIFLADKNDLPWMWLSEEQELILCGKLDYILKENDTVTVLDFKTNFKATESETSLQLPIYSVLLDHFLPDYTIKAAYWYIAFQESPVSKTLPSVSDSRKQILALAKDVKRARLYKEFDCPHGGCPACSDLERVLKGEGKFVGLNQYGGKQYKL